jgi:hypothetical protein
MQKRPQVAKCLWRKCQGLCTDQAEQAAAAMMADSCKVQRMCKLILTESSNSEHTQAWPKSGQQDSCTAAANNCWTGHWPPVAH